jgi:hypothetical protein
MGVSYEWWFWSSLNRQQIIKRKTKKLYAMGCRKWSGSPKLGRRLKCKVLCKIFDVEKQVACDNYSSRDFPIRFVNNIPMILCQM